MANETVKFVASNGSEAIIAVDSDYILKNITGLSTVGVAFETEKGYLQDGQYYLNTSIDVRIMNINIGIKADSFSSLLDKRRALQKVFNPTLGLGTLYYSTPNYDRKISCGVSIPISISEKHETDEVANVTLTAPNPYLQDLTTQSLELADYVGGLTFPMSFPISFADRAQQGTVTNDGDVNTPVIITFNGPAENPAVTLAETGEYVKVTTTLTSTQKLIIDTAYDKNTVILDDDGTQSSAFNLIDSDSNFFSLPVGDSTIEFSTDGATDDPTVDIEFYNLYIGA